MLNFKFTNNLFLTKFEINSTLCYFKIGIIFSILLLNVQDLKNKIRLACNNLGEEEINASISREFLKRLESRWKLRTIY
jgi:ABC-type uncharacterized transport system permease subunit